MIVAVVTDCVNVTARRQCVLLLIIERISDQCVSHDLAHTHTQTHTRESEPCRGQLIEKPIGRVISRDAVRILACWRIIKKW